MFETSGSGGGCRGTESQACCRVHRDLLPGAISGGAFNPAVAIGQILHGAVGFSAIWKYWLAQFLAGAVAGSAFMMINGAEARDR
jgi:glycerol uptake facilitator-like aquaporin